MELQLGKSIESGAEFSDNKNYRFSLWRIWDRSKPLVMFIGLNPSTANETTNDPTIKRVIAIANNLGYGGVYMLNCFPLVSTDPKALNAFGETPFHDIEEAINDKALLSCSKLCVDVVFAWGNFKIVNHLGADFKMKALFPEAKALHVNKNGSPKHPLYCRADSQLIKFNQSI